MKSLKNLDKKLSLLFSSVLVMLVSCDSVELREHLEKDDMPPGPVKDITIENLPGAAKISYTLPDDEDVLYVAGEYEIRPGAGYNVKSSYYSNSLTVVGFGKTDEYTVDLYTVDRSGNRSEKKTVKVNPLTPPVQQSFETLDYDKGFGGIHLTFENAAKANLVTNVLIKDEYGDWIEYDKYYTGLPMGNYSVRNLNAVPTIFGVFLKDRWGNLSDTLVREVTPLFEMQLDKKKFRAVPLPGDHPNDWNITGIWNDITSNTAASGGFSSVGPFPKYFQFSLGTRSRLSRFKLWGVHDGREYSSGNIREFEVWGSNNPDPQGSFDGWELLGTYTVVKPSGLPDPEVNADDRAVAVAGFDFEVSPDAPAVLYLRVNMLSSFASPRNSPNGTAWVREMTFWGQEQP